MAVLRHPDNFDNPVSCIATLAFFCGVLCVSLMLKFGGFKANLKFFNGNRRKSHREYDEIGTTMSITGAYRTNRDELLGYNYSDTQRKSTPTNLPVPTMEQPPTPLRQVRSTSDMIRDKNLPPNLRQENPGISQDPRGAEQNEPRNSRIQAKNKNKERKLDAEKKVEKQKLAEQKKLEKQRLDEEKRLEKERLDEQKKTEKLAQQEQARQEKLRKEREKKEAQQAKKDKKKKKPAPQRPNANPLAQADAGTSNPLAQGPQMQYSTNTLNSSISKTSGPPPYSNVPKPEIENDSTGNVTYVKPEDTGSWDMISKHRQNINRPINASTSTPTKQTVMDLNYKVDEGEVKENSEA